VYARIIYIFNLTRCSATRKANLDLLAVLLYILSTQGRNTCPRVFNTRSYGLDDRAIEVRSPAETKDFSCTMGTGGPFSGAKGRPGCDAVHSPPSSAGVENVYVYLLSPHAPSGRVVGQL
jgi:hypothetical protein